MEKAEGAFLTISELAVELGLPQHILRYWETRFPQLRPLQRSGNRRYYRPADVALARRIDHLLNVEGFTVKGAQKALADGEAPTPVVAPAIPATPPRSAPSDRDDILTRLLAIRTDLARAIGD
ncbi:MerR family transcriptional regulator [Sphingobium sp. CR2-8]|uniref:MerR family transcriptional regulator n=1 Tax=Sphingobium sp. CR2-8 TaxID=1306534 RepID=UPI002DB6CC72|nr:MerR family transcriptional regulator [Sphingobium sp. CR2-8]MEC3912605.1 MerR family transcriptional regulator [Sphingobium sp. CR2-8]